MPQEAERFEQHGQSTATDDACMAEMTKEERKKEKEEEKGSAAALGRPHKAHSRNKPLLPSAIAGRNALCAERHTTSRTSRALASTPAEGSREGRRRRQLTARERQLCPFFSSPSLPPLSFPSLRLRAMQRRAAAVLSAAAVLLLAVSGARAECPAEGTVLLEERFDELTLTATESSFGGSTLVNCNHRSRIFRLISIAVSRAVFLACIASTPFTLCRGHACHARPSATRVCAPPGRRKGRGKGGRVLRKKSRDVMNLPRLLPPPPLPPRRAPLPSSSPLRPAAHSRPRRAGRLCARRCGGAAGTRGLWLGSRGMWQNVRPLVISRASPSPPVLLFPSHAPFSLSHPPPHAAFFCPPTSSCPMPLFPGAAARLSGLRCTCFVLIDAKAAETTTSQASSLAGLRSFFFQHSLFPSLLSLHGESGFDIGMHRLETWRSSCFPSHAGADTSPRHLPPQTTLPPQKTYGPPRFLLGGARASVPR